MAFSYSSFGRKFSGPSGILELMDDLGAAMAGQSDLVMMGGGNPATIPEVAAVWRQRLAELLEDPEQLDRILANYDPPNGNLETLTALADLLNREYGWGIGPENLAVTAGGQTAFYFLLNFFSGDMDGRTRKRILLPIMPEYIGYENQGLRAGTFIGKAPKIRTIDERTFKYQIDFDRLQLGEDVGAICVSRPTNPTGNVLTDEEVRRLSELAAEKGIPLILDNAYGAPFPGILFTETSLQWNENLILTMSLSKLGLPGTRTAFVVAAPEVIKAIRGCNAVVALANNNIGQALVRPLLSNGKLLELSREVIQPFYKKKRDQTLKWLAEAFAGKAPYALHQSEGAIFFWIHFPELPVSSRVLYERLKARGLLVVPGSYFFFGLEAPHPHEDNCLRLTYSQPDDQVARGVEILADEVSRIYAGN